MKRFHTILAVFSLLTAMSLASCTKDPVTEEPLPIEKNGDGSSTQETGTKPETKYEPFTVSLPDVSDTLAYKGHPVTVAFEVTATMPETVQVSILSSKGGEASVSYDATQKTGKLTYTLSGDCAEVSVRFTDGTTTKDCLARATAYYLRIAKADDTIVSEEGEERFLDLDTNLPEGAILIESPDWIATAIKDGRITVRFAPSEARDERTGIVSIRDAEAFLDPVTMEFRQDWALSNGEGMIQFKDKAFKTAMLEIADTNRDGDVSFEEAETVQEIVIDGRGVKDLSGLDAFKNVWKLDARDNDIENADILTELHYLHWLDLRGNTNLRSFDVTGCSIYFNHCEFECNDDLHYYAAKRAVGVSGYCRYTDNLQFVTLGSDPQCKHSTHVDDPFITTDWSLQNRIHLYHGHTSGDGLNRIVFTGMGYTERDIKDGTYQRIMEEAIESFIKNFLDEKLLSKVDIYYMDRMIDRHDPWPYRTYNPVVQYVNEYREESYDTICQAFGAVTTGNPADWETTNSFDEKVLVYQINIVPDIQTPWGVIGSRKSRHLHPEYNNDSCWVARYTLTPAQYRNQSLGEEEPWWKTWRIEDMYHEIVTEGIFDEYIENIK